MQQEHYGNIDFINWLGSDLARSDLDSNRGSRQQSCSAHMQSLRMHGPQWTLKTQIWVMHRHRHPVNLYPQLFKAADLPLLLFIRVYILTGHTYRVCEARLLVSMFQLFLQGNPSTGDVTWNERRNTEGLQRCLPKGQWKKMNAYVGQAMLKNLLSCCLLYTYTTYSSIVWAQ